MKKPKMCREKIKCKELDLNQGLERSKPAH